MSLGHLVKKKIRRLTNLQKDTVHRGLLVLQAYIILSTIFVSIICYSKIHVLASVIYYIKYYNYTYTLEQEKFITLNYHIL